MDGWNTTFLWGWPLFQVLLLLVSGKISTWTFKYSAQFGKDCHLQHNRRSSRSFLSSPFSPCLCACDQGATPQGAAKINRFLGLQGTNYLLDSFVQPAGPASLNT